MPDINNIGLDWLYNKVGDMTHEINHILPSEYNEKYRYLPESVTNIPGYIRYDVNPFMREILDCFDIDSPVREVNVKKGVQVTYSTLLESGTFYFIGHVKTLPMMYMTVDKEMAEARIENNFIPMLNHSGMRELIRSSDIGNTKKTGLTKKHLQWIGDGYLIPFGAQKADKMRSFSMCVMMKDEIDGWPDTVGKDGDPDGLSDDRCSAYWDRRKIFRGSTPLIYESSKIEFQFLRGDQRKYNVLCKSCSFPQELRWEKKNKEKKITGGFKWDYVEKDILDIESVRYCCQDCGEEHYEHDKERLFSEESGAKWIPTAKPKEPNIRSYHLPAFYSPIGMQPWYKCVSDYLKGFDPVTKKVTNIGKYQKFYNNILAEPFKMKGAKVYFEQVSAHRRTEYTYGIIPNTYAKKHSGSPVLMLVCTVDVHKKCIFVKVAGWCKGSISYLIDYWKFESKVESSDCRTDINNNVWQELRELIETKNYTADDGKKYKINFTLIDANGTANDTVVKFCNQYAYGVVPILGRERTAKASKIKEFSTFTTIANTIGYTITVDHYKDRIASSLRREWVPESGEQKPYHFNAPVDITTNQLKELNAEELRKKVDPKGKVYYEWHRPGNKPNELWDLFVYGHAGVEIIAYNLCIEQFELDTIDWEMFWDFIEKEESFFEAA